MTLDALLDEAVDRAEAAIRERAGDGASDGDVRTNAEAIGIAAIKYADLQTERSKDYVFSFDRMVSFEGNTGPYLLYARPDQQHVRESGGAAGSMSSHPNPRRSRSKRMRRRRWRCCCCGRHG